MNSFRQKLKEIKKYVNKDFMRIKLESNEIILRIVDTNDDTVDNHDIDISDKDYRKSIFDLFNHLQSSE